MVKLVKKELVSEAKQVGTLYHVTTVEAVAEYIAPRDILKGSGKYNNWLLGGRSDVVSFTRDKNFVITTYSNMESNVLLSFEVDGDKLSEHRKIIPYNDLAFSQDTGELIDEFIDPKYLEHEEAVVGSISHFSEYVKKVRFGVSISSFADILITYNSVDLKKASSYLSQFDTAYDSKLVLKRKGDFALEYPSFSSFVDSFTAINTFYNTEVYSIDTAKVKKVFSVFKKDHLDTLLLKTLMDGSLENRQTACCILVYAGANYKAQPIQALLRSDVKYVHFLWPVLSDEERLEYAKTHITWEMVKPNLDISNITDKNLSTLANKKGKDLVNALVYYKILSKSDIEDFIYDSFLSYLEDSYF